MSLKAVLAQALSRNKAIEKKLLWEQKHREDHGSANTMSLKSRDGEVRTVTILPKDALVSPNHVDVYELERQRSAEDKENALLTRVCDGRDVWHAGNLLTQDKEVPRRPADLFTNPAFLQRVVAAYEKKRLAKAKKKEKKKEKEEAKRKKKKRKKKQKVNKQKTKKPSEKKHKKNKKREKSNVRKTKASSTSTSSGSCESSDDASKCISSSSAYDDDHPSPRSKRIKA